MAICLRLAIVFGLLLGATALPGQSLGDVARASREQPRPHAKRVITNDDLPSSAPAESVTVKETSKADTKGAPPADEKSKREAAEKQRAELAESMLRQQQKVTLLERELQVSQRERDRRIQQHNNDVNERISGQQQWMQAEKTRDQEMSEKQEKLNAEREKLSQIESQARQSGVKLPD